MEAYKKTFLGRPMFIWVMLAFVLLFIICQEEMKQRMILENVILERQIGLR